MICDKCQRWNCRVAYWEEQLALATSESPYDRARVHMPAEDIERAVSSAKVICFIRAGQRSASPR